MSPSVAPAFAASAPNSAAATAAYKPTYVLFYPHGLSQPAGSATLPAGAFTPAQIKQAYGIDQVYDNGTLQDGTGETIAIIDAYDNPKFVSRSSNPDVNQDTAFLASDLHQFDAQFGLPEPPGFFTKVNESGGTSSYPSGDSGWGTEIALDVEWAHAIAPRAKIVLIEANTATDNDLFNAAAVWARDSSGAATVSMSFGGGESSGQTSIDSIFHSPASHGITWCASTGDSGVPGGYPAFSPNVLAVGGTTLTAPNGVYSSEAGWNGSGGGVSTVESQPAYQQGLVIHNGSTVVNPNGHRSIPDISFDADPNSGPVIYDSYGYSNPWMQIGGTSFSSPATAAEIAIVDQMRANHGQTSMDGLTQTMPTLYSLYHSATTYPTDFHDVKTGNNGDAAGVGYDLVTGTGTPIANDLLPDLAGVTLRVISTTPAIGAVLQTPPTSYSITFSNAIDPSSLTAGVLTVNGIPATGVTLSSNHKTATFTFNANPVAGQGLQTMAMAANSVTEQGSPSTGLESFTGTFRYDVVLQQVTSTSPVAGGLFTLPSPLTYTMNFNEAVLPSSVSTGSIFLSGISGATVQSYNVLSGGMSVQFIIGGISGEGNLGISLPAGGVTDPYGNPCAPYSASYSTDIVTAPFPTPLTAELPLGSMVYDGSVKGLVNFSTDTDSWTLNLNAGQTLSAYVAPSSALKPVLTILDPTGATVGTATATAAGAQAVVQTLSVATAGAYTLVVSSAGGSVGSYTLNAVLNAALDNRLHAGVNNGAIATAQSLESAFVTPAGALPSAQRAAVVGQSNPYGYTTSSPAYTFEEIKSTGTSISFAGVYDDSENVPIGFTFPFYGANYANLYVSTSGLISFGVADPSYTNTDLSASPSEPVIAPFWDFLAVSGASDSKVVYQTIGSGSSQHLDIEWNNLSFAYDSTWAGGLTFEAQLYANGTIRFNYRSLVTGQNGGAYDRGKTAAVGVKDSGTSNPSHITLVYHNGPTAQVNSPKSVVFTPTSPTGDYYSFNLTAGQRASVVLSSPDADSATIQLYGPSQVLLATGAAAVTVSEAIDNFVAPADGAYYVRVTPGKGVNYNLVVTRGLGFSTQSNETLATAQDIGPSSGGVRAVLGSVGGGSAEYYGWDYNSSSLFSIAASTGAITMLGPSGLSTYIYGLAYDPAHHILYGTDTADLYTFNLTTGAGTLLGALPTSISYGLTFDPVDGMLYTVNYSGTLLRINPSTLVCTAVSSPGPGSFAYGVAYDPADQRIYCEDYYSQRIYSYDAVSYAGPVFDATPSVSVNYCMTYNGASLVLAPGTAAGETLYSYDPNSGACTALYPTTLLDAVSVEALVYVSNYNADNVYSVSANAGDNLAINTSTPSDGPNLFGNTLAPQIDLYDPSGNLVASGTVGTDGRNESLNYTATLTGAYEVRVTAQNKTQGEYVLAVQGATGGLAPFAVTSTSPANGSYINYVPTTVTVTFNSVILATTLQNADLLIDGVADNSSIALVFLNGKSVVFTLPNKLAQGTHTISLNAGSLDDLQGAPLTAYSGSFVLDTIPPTVTGTSTKEGQILTGGSLTYVATFDEAMNTAMLTASAFSLVGTINGVQTPVSYRWLNPEQVQLVYSNLPSDAYTLTLVSAAGDFQDLAGNLLDGEPHNPFRLPSGDGTAGGNFYVHFSEYIPVMTFPALTVVNPRGSLVYQSSARSLISAVGFAETYTLSVEPGQTISVDVAPTGTTLKPTVQLVGPDGSVIATATASAAGGHAVIQLAPTAATNGTYQVVVGGASSTTGFFTVQVALNAAFDLEGRIAGTTNNTIGTAQNIDGAFTNLTTSVAAAQRAAVLGQTAPFGGYTVSSPSYSFEDISKTGTPITFTYPYYDSELVPIGFTFPMYGVSYTSLYVSTAGLLSFGVSDPSVSNSDLSASPAEAAIAAFWDFLYVGSAADSKVVYQTVGSGSTQHLDVQWNDISFADDSTWGGGLTFEAQLYASGSIRLNYKSLYTGHNSGAYDGGKTATVGIKDAGSTNPSHKTLVYHNGPTNQVSNVRSVLFTAAQPSNDYYSFTAASAETDTISVTNGAAGNLTLALLNASGAVIASGTSGATKVAEMISNESLAAGKYYIRVSGDANVPYNIVVTRNAAFGAAPNYTAATAQPLSGVNGVLADSLVPGSTLTMDEVPEQPVDGLTVKGVTFGYAISGAPSSECYYGAYGPGVTEYTSDPSIVGLASGDLSFSFAQPVTSMQFGVALDMFAADAAGATVSLYAAGGGLIGTYPVPVALYGYSFPSGLFSYSGATPVASATVSFDSSAAPEFAFDNLTYSVSGSNWYTLTVPAAGSMVRLATATPGYGSGEFSNSLVPTIQLYDSTGTNLLASGTVGSDGHNQTLTYTGAAAGTYYVCLAGANRTLGEYYLADQVTAPGQVADVASSTANGVYGPGANIAVTVTFGGPVTVTGTPLLALSTGGTASYSGGSGTNTLTFTYVVANGENSARLDCASATALALNGGTILDANNNPANLTLPAPGAAGSLAADANLVIDTTDPTVVDYRVLFGPSNMSSFSLTDSTRQNDLPWQITGIEVVFSKPIANGRLHSLSGVTATGFSGLGTDTLTWTISPISDGSFATMLAGSGVNALTDAAGNPLYVGNGYAQNFNVLLGDATDTGAVTSGDILAVYRDMSPAAYNLFDDLNGDGAVDMNDVQIARLQEGAALPPVQPAQVSSTSPAGAALLFGGLSPQTNTCSLAAGSQVDSVTFLDNAGATLVNGNAVDLAGDIVDASSSFQTVALPLVLTGGSHTLSAAAGNLTIAAAISESGGANSLVVTGPGTVTLSGANTFTGGATVASGTLILTSAAALLDGSALTVGGAFPVASSAPSATIPTRSASEGGAPPIASVAAPTPSVNAAIPTRSASEAAIPTRSASEVIPTASVASSAYTPAVHFPSQSSSASGGALPILAAPPRKTAVDAALLQILQRRLADRMIAQQSAAARPWLAAGTDTAFYIAQEQGATPSIAALDTVWASYRV